MSSSLVSKKCVPCEGGVLPFDMSQIDAHRKELNLVWNVVDQKQIQREFIFKDFKAAMVFVNKVAEIAEEEGHHPDTHIFYNKVRLELSTHSIHGLSENDFIVAAKIEELL